MKGILGFLVAKRWNGKVKKKKQKTEQTGYAPLIMDDAGISFGYVRDGETVRDLQ